MPVLRQAIIDMIVQEGVEQFYVGSQGRFDAMVRELLKELLKSYHFRYDIVLAYPPTPERNEIPKGHPTLLPDGQEQVPLKFAIDRRNRWMVEKSHYVISYTYKSHGGAVKFTALANKRGLSVLSL